MGVYEVPAAIEVEQDGSVLIVRLNRPERLNATNHELHQGLAELFPQVDADDDVRVVVLTGAGQAFSAGGDFEYIDELSRDASLRKLSLTHGRQIVTGMVACRVPIVAAVNGPAVGLGCSLVALSDVVFMAESAHLADPHVAVGLVAADGGPVTWPLLTSLQLAKEYALTGDRIPAARAAQIGLVNHVCPDDEVIEQAMACAHKIAKLPRRAVEDTKRILNLNLERAVLATLDFALAAEDRSFTSPELRANIDRLLGREQEQLKGQQRGELTAAQHVFSQVPSQLTRAAEQLLEDQNPTDVAVQVVLGREPDACKDLLAMSSRGPRPASGDGLRHRRGLRREVEPGRVQHGVGRFDRNERLGQAVTHRLERCDRAVELDPLERVLTSELEHPS